MGLLDLFRSKQKNTANLAKQRLQIIIAQGRVERGGPDYLPMLKRELLEVIRKYVHVDRMRSRSTSAPKATTKCSR